MSPSGNQPAIDPADRDGQRPFERFSAPALPRVDEAGARGRADWGLFGPDSITWRVHAHPIIVVGGFRALVIQSLYPLAMAGISQYSDYKTDPLKRFRRTAQYVHHITFSEAAAARQAAARVRRIHEQVKGTDPVTGREFSANDPETLLWVHCAGAHSFLKAYTTFVEPLSREEADRYLAEQVTSAELVGVPREMVPNSADAYREYFAAMLPSLCNSHAAADTIRFVLKPDIRSVRVADWPFALNLKFAAAAGATLIPRSLRQITGLPMPGPRELAISSWTRLNGRAMRQALRVQLLASRYDSYAERTLGVQPVPAMARRAV